MARRGIDNSVRLTPRDRSGTPKGTTSKASKTSRRNKKKSTGGVT